MIKDLNRLKPYRYIGERVVWGSTMYFDRTPPMYFEGMNNDLHFVIRLFVDDDLHSFRFFENGTYWHTAWDVKGSFTPEEAEGNYEAFDSLNWNWAERIELRGEQHV